MQLVGAAEVALLLGVSRQRVHQLVSTTGFPEPVERLAAGAVWRTADITDWADRQGRVTHLDLLDGPTTS